MSSFDLNDLQGFLKKKKKQKAFFGSSSAPRFFRVEKIEGDNDRTEYALCYYNHPREQEARGWIYLDDVFKLSDDTVSFVIHTPDRVLDLEPQTPHEFDVWLRGLCHLCSKAKKELQSTLKPFKDDEDQELLIKKKDKLSKSPKREKNKEHKQKTNNMSKWDNDKSIPAAEREDHRMQQGYRNGTGDGGGTTSRLHGHIRRDIDNSFAEESRRRVPEKEKNDIDEERKDGDYDDHDSYNDMMRRHKEKTRMYTQASRWEEAVTEEVLDESKLPDGIRTGNGTRSPGPNSNVDGGRRGTARPSPGGKRHYDEDDDDDVEVESMNLDMSRAQTRRMRIAAMRQEREREREKENEREKGDDFLFSSPIRNSNSSKDKNTDTNIDHDATPTTGAGASESKTNDEVYASPEVVNIRRARDGLFTDSPDKDMRSTGRARGRGERPQVSIDDLISTSRKLSMDDKASDIKLDSYGAYGNVADSKFDIDVEKRRLATTSSISNNKNDSGSSSSSSNDYSRDTSKIVNSSPSLTKSGRQLDKGAGAKSLGNIDEEMNAKRSDWEAAAAVITDEGPKEKERKKPPRPPSGPRPHNIKGLPYPGLGEPGVAPDKNFLEDNWDNDSPIRSDRNADAKGSSNSGGGGRGVVSAGWNGYAGGVKPDTNFVEDDWDD